MSAPDLTGVSPSRAVLAQIEAGATSTDEIARRTGLDADLVSVMIDRLVAAGYLTAQRLKSGCPETGCSSCPVVGACAPVRGTARGAVMIGLGPTRRRGRTGSGATGA